MDADSDKIIQKIREFTEPIYQLGEKKAEGTWKVTQHHIKSKYKGKPDQASDAILKFLVLFKEVTTTIQKLEQENEDLRKKTSSSEIVQTFGEKILKYVSDNIKENNKSLATSTNKLKTYADALESKKSCIVNNTSATSIKTTIKDVIRENKVRDEKSKNIIIYGVQEMDDENNIEQVKSIMTTIEEKSNFEHKIPILHVTRIGEKCKEKTRPIRVTLSEQYMVHDILKYCKVLRGSGTYKNVYISMDRSIEQQKVHKELILRLKQSIRNHPDKYWYIKNGNLCSRQKESSIQLQGDESDSEKDYPPLEPSFSRNSEPEVVQHIKDHESRYKENGPRLFQK